jgi:hypothetical protein
MPPLSLPALPSGQPTAWEEAIYAFLVEASSGEAQAPHRALRSPRSIGRAPVSGGRPHMSKGGPHTMTESHIGIALGWRIY